MSIEELLGRLEGLSLWVVLAVLLAPPILSIVIGLLLKERDGGDGPWRYVYSGLVYWTGLPGILACVLTAYSLFFVRQNLLRVNLVLYFLPIAAMIVTLVLIRRSVEWDDLPGVERLFAFTSLIAVSMIIALAVLKMRIWLFFGGSIFMFLAIALVAYLILKISFHKLTRETGGGGPNGSASNMKKEVENELRRIKRDLERK